MKKIFLFTILVLITTFIFAQTDINKTIDNFNKTLNSLPKTQVLRNLIYKYSIEWVEEEKSFLLTKTQYYTDEERKNIIENYEIILSPQYLHQKGIFIKDEGKNNISFQIFTASNTPKILSVFNQNLAMFKDRVALGNWKKKEVYEKIKALEVSLINIIEYYSNWTAKERPNINIPLKMIVIDPKTMKPFSSAINLEN